MYWSPSAVFSIAILLPADPEGLSEPDELEPVDASDVRGFCLSDMGTLDAKYLGLGLAALRVLLHTVLAEGVLLSATF